MAVMSYARALAWHAERQPDAPALWHDEAHLSRAELERRANRLARSYRERGVREGALVTLALPNGLEFFAACLAVWKLGATPQPISSRLPERERRAIVALADPALVVGVAEGEYGGRAALPPGFEPDAGVVDTPLPDVVPRHARAMTSGGSTGQPKLIVDTSPAECDPEATQNGMRAGGTTLVPGPLYHAGPFLTAWQQLLCGGQVVVMSRFDAQGALERIERHRVDWVLFVPTMMQRIWRLSEAERRRFDLTSLNVVMCTGAPSPAWLKRAWIDWLGPEKILEAYGGTERIAGTLISGSEWLRHPGSVGRPTLGRRLRTLREDGSECAPGEIGEVFMLAPGGRGSTYRYVGAEAPATTDGWESIGDLGWLDADGYLYLADRRTDMIVTGGANLYPAEVEAALDAHPDVRSSAVIGLPDDDLGQRVHAIVQAARRLDPEALRAHLAEHLVRYKIPRSFEFVDEPLRDDAGKLRRSALREARLGAAGGAPAQRAQDRGAVPSGGEPCLDGSHAALACAAEHRSTDSLESANIAAGSVARWREIVRIWGTTADERKAPFPCDELLPDFNEAYFRGIGIRAEPPVVFRWLCQLRVAPYSYDWIDNLGRSSPRQLTPGLEQLAVGQPVMRIFDLVAFEPEHHLTLRLREPGLFPPLAVSYVTAQSPSHGCRLLVKLVVRLRPGLRDRLLASILPWGDWIMMRRQLLNLKEHAESTASAPSSRSEQWGWHGGRPPGDTR